MLLDHRDDEELAALDEALRRHEAELVAVREQLAEPVLAAVGELAGARPRRLCAAGLRDVEQARDLRGRSAGDARPRGPTRWRRLAAELDRLAADRVPVAERHHTVDGLARLAEGKSTDNRLRMSLSGYVLAARLEQVAVAASDRLLRMSSGRYQLVHTAEGAHRAVPGRAAAAGARRVDRRGARPGDPLRRRELLGRAGARARAWPTS